MQDSIWDKNEKKDACIAAKQLIWFIFLCSVGITAIVYLGRNFILHSVFGAIDADVMSSANTYLMIVTASIPLIALYNGGAAIFRAMGNSKVSMQVSIVMNVINVAGNASFNLWISQRDRRRCNTYLGIQNGGGNTDFGIIV